MIKHIPNILTSIRFLLVPFVVISSLSGNNILAIILILTASFTDILDGTIARKYNVISTFGKLMDPLADKFMQVSILIVLFILKLVPLWIVLIFVLKELILIIGSIFLYKKDMVVSSNWYGKLATVVIYLAIIFSMIINHFDLNNFYELNKYLYYFAIVLTLFSCIMYSRKNFFKGFLNKK